MKAYKLTDENGVTFGGTKWGEGVMHEANGLGELCGPGWLHYYDDPVLAVMLNPLHADFGNPLLWEAEAEGQIKSDNGLKFGCTKLTTVKRIDLPAVTTTQRVRFAILCAKQVCIDPAWNVWADKWLSREDRAEAAWATAAWATAAKRAAETWAARAEAWAAWAAAERAAAAEAQPCQLDLKAIAREAMRGD